jgi:hypothetical protein
MRKLESIIIATLLATCAPMAHGQQATADIPISSKSGLEVSTADSMPVIVEQLSNDGEKLGLTREKIEARVNSVLRKNGLKPIDESADEGFSYYYYVNVNVVSVAIAIEVDFNRHVRFNDGINERIKFGASTWSRGMLSTCRSCSAASILDKVSELTEVFVNEFLKANRK